MRSEGKPFRALTIACFALAAMFVFAAPASAQWRFGAFAGFEHDAGWDEFLVIGADARKQTDKHNLELNPRFSWFLREDLTRFQLDLNALKRLDVAGAGKFEPYIGTGLAFERISFDFPGFDSESALGFNYILGTTVKSSGKFQLFGQFVYTVLNDSPNNAVVSAGIHWK
jgi:opacity protein-like surface antigen